MLGKSTVVLWFGMALLPAVAQAGEWPQFRGPQSAGVAAKTTLPAQWGPDKNVQWKITIPGVAWSSPVVWGDKVFVTTAVTDNQRKPQAGGGFGGPGGGGPGGFGGPGRGGPGRGGPGGFGGPGQILPPFLQERLNLTDQQKKEVEELQKEIDSKIEKILTAEQFKDMRAGSGRGGPGGFGGPGGGGRGGPGRGGFGGPGQILPPFLQERLKLTDQQKRQVEDLQKETDSKVEKILTAEQNKQFKEMRAGFGRGGPGGFGGPGGGGRGGFGGGRPPDVVYRWQIYCIDRTTGNVLWKQIALEGKPRIPIQQSNTYATETPVTDGERVYAYFGMHGLFCYDFSGKLLWKKDLGAYPTVMGQGPASSPVIDGERLFLQIDNEENSFLVALNTKSGDELWRVTRNERTNHCSPIVWKNKKRTELVTSGSQKVRSYDPATGKILWELGMGGGRCYSTPVGDRERLYVGCEGGFGGGAFGGGPGGPGDDQGPPGGGRGAFGGGGGGLFAVRAGASGDLTLKQAETSNAGVAWSQPRSGPEKASPLVYQGYLYILRGSGGLLTCYDAKTGKQVYRERLPRAASFWASPWACDGKIFCLDDNGTTHIIQAGPEFKVLGQNSVDEMCWASPAVADEALFMRGVDHLYCIKAKAEER
jgi:outer membrane protein assembly factor BamB